jgi:hypothetical protein
MTRWMGPRTISLPLNRTRAPTCSGRSETAHHESGHAAAALFLKLPLGRVVLHPDGGGAMYQTGSRPEALPDETARSLIDKLKRDGVRLTDQWVKNDLMLTFAGPAAGVRVGGHDLDGHDEASVRRLITMLARSEAEALQAFDEAHARAHRLVDEFWPVIEDVALKLDAAGELSGDEVRAVCRRSVLGRRLIGEEEPARFTNIGALSGAGEVRTRTDDAANRRAALEAMCIADGFALHHFDSWLRNCFLYGERRYRSKNFAHGDARL